MKKFLSTMTALMMAAAMVAPAYASPRDTDMQLARKWDQAQKSCEGNGPTKRVIYQACGVADRHAEELTSRGYCLNEDIKVWALCSRKK